MHYGPINNNEWRVAIPEKASDLASTIVTSKSLHKILSIINPAVDDPLTVRNGSVSFLDARCKNLRSTLCFVNSRLSVQPSVSPFVCHGGLLWRNCNNAAQKRAVDGVYEQPFGNSPRTLGDDRSGISLWPYITLTCVEHCLVLTEDWCLVPVNYWSPLSIGQWNQLLPYALQT